MRPLLCLRDPYPMSKLEGTALLRSEVWGHQMLCIWVPAQASALLGAAEPPHRCFLGPRSSAGGLPLISFLLLGPHLRGPRSHAWPRLPLLSNPSHR